MLSPLHVRALIIIAYPDTYDKVVTRNAVSDTYIRRSICEYTRF